MEGVSGRGGDDERGSRGRNILPGLETDGVWLLEDFLEKQQTVRGLPFEF